MKLLKSTLRVFLHIDNLIVSVLTVSMLCVLLTIIHRLEFMDPVAKVIDELSMADIYYRINYSGEETMNEEITIVDITQLSERQRDSIAFVVGQITSMKPTVLGVDVIFEHPLCNVQNDEDLVLSFLDCPENVPVILAEKLTEPNWETSTYRNAVHSFFAKDIDCTEGCINVLGKPMQSITTYPVYLLHGSDTVYSLPAQMAAVLSGKKITPDTGFEHTINYDGTKFHIVDYRELQKNRHLIEGHSVLLGAAYEETDKHVTPIGYKSGITILAHTLNSMEKGYHVWHGGIVWIVLVAILAGCLMNAFEYFMTWIIRTEIPALLKKRRLLFLEFFTESEIYDKIVAFAFMVLFTGFTYWLYTRHAIYVNTWLALGTIAFIEEGRLFYKAMITYWRRKNNPNAFKNSLYAKELEHNEESK